MRIVQVASYFPPPYGGIESHVYYLSKELVELGHEVTVLTSRVPEAAIGKEEISEGVVVKRLWTPFSLFNFPFMPTLTYRVLREEVDVFHGHINAPMTVESGALGSLFSGVPFVVTYHADLIPEDIGIESMALRGLIYDLYEKFVKRFDVAVAGRILATTPLYAETSEFLRDYLDKVSIVPNGVDLERFRPNHDVSSIRSRLGFDRERIVFFAGRLIPYKGLEYLLAAFSEVCKAREDVRLVLLGAGPLLDDLQRQVYSIGLKDKVRFLGAVSEDNLPHFFATSDVVVVPSRSRSEGFSISALQAMASGKPVVATRVGGVPDVVIDEETGIIVEPRNTEQLSSAILRFLNDPDLAAQMGRAGRRRAERYFGWRRVAELVEKVYKDLV